MPNSGSRCRGIRVTDPKSCQCGEVLKGAKPWNLECSRHRVRRDQAPAWSPGERVRGLPNFDQTARTPLYDQRAGARRRDLDGATVTDSAQMFARYAFAPNRLGYCGRRACAGNPAGRAGRKSGGSSPVTWPTCGRPSTISQHHRSVGSPGGQLLFGWRIPAPPIGNHTRSAVRCWR